MTRLIVVFRNSANKPINEFKIIFRRREVKRSLWRYTCGLDNYMKILLKEMICHDLEWILVHYLNL